MFISIRLNRFKVLLSLAVFISVTFFAVSIYSGIQKSKNVTEQARPVTSDTAPAAEKKFIKWVDFKVTSAAMQKAMKLDIESQNAKIRLDWIELLAILGAKYGGDFSRFRDGDLTTLANHITNGEKVADITKDMQYYSYYHQAYSAVLEEFLGEYEIQSTAPDSKTTLYEKKYGLKAFSPIAKGYGYSHYDDFGSSRSYGYKRKHLGHDMMGSVGTPIIAIESGTIEALGWNQYGGWRIGIRSFDKKRYYYYAHLRKNHPYPKDLAVGSTVKAGDVIGYLGMTGYSSKENVNNIDTPHLHMGIQLIFDESQKDGNSEIWIDCYEIAKFLSRNTSAVVKDEFTGEYRRKLDFFEKSVENME